MYNSISSVMKKTYKNIQVNSIKSVGFNIEGVFFWLFWLFLLWFRDNRIDRILFLQRMQFCLFLSIVCIPITK